MVFVARFFRAIPAMGMLWLVLAPGQAWAVPPPDLPLPPCIVVDGRQQGACVVESPDVTGAAIGALTAGSRVDIMTIPMHPVCDYHYGHDPYTWAPSPCYSAVVAPSIAGCAVIDLRNGGEQFYRLPCNDALYKRPQDVPQPWVTLTGPNGSTRCNAAGDYQTYLYGGPANTPGRRWAEFGPAYLDCAMTFNGPRPDGLYGPTWMIMNVGIHLSQNGDERRGHPRSAQIFVKVDGDMRQEGVDVAVTGAVVLDEANWDAGRLLATYTATVRNVGSERSEAVRLTATLPSVMAAMEVADADCWLPGTQKGVLPQPDTRVLPGRTVTCEWASLAINETRTVRIKTRILNATDLQALQSGVALQNFQGDPQGVRMRVATAEDRVSANDEVLVKVQIPFLSGSYDATRAAMEVLAPYFDYREAPLSFKACNTYKERIFERLQVINRDHPEVFANLSYGAITSGDYQMVPGIDHPENIAGHVGVVVYVKGTDYRQTGIIINGTPAPSPLTLMSEVGPHGSTEAIGWTGLDGLYLRTQANRFPGTPHPEGNSLIGFEAIYVDNAAEYTYGGVGGSIPGPDAGDATTCPAPPDAVVIATESPVDIQITNPRGQRVHTEGGMLIAQELDIGITSIAMPHDDGTFGWTLLLPKDEYDIRLTGTATGPYKLKIITFDANGGAIEQVAEGTTAPGKVDDYVFDGVAGTGSGPGPGPGTGTGSGPGAGNGNASGGGGGHMGWPALLGLLLLGVNRRRWLVAR